MDVMKSRNAFSFRQRAGLSDAGDPVRTIAAFRLLDDAEMLSGYMDGFSGRPLGTGKHSRSTLHGWRNGMIESGREPPDSAYLELRHAFARKRLAN